MTRYALLIHPSANRVEAGAADSLTVAEPEDCAFLTNISSFTHRSR
jgi:hypothetical protein